MQYERVCGVYIIASPDHNFLYTGMSTSLPWRIQTHREGIVMGYANDHNCKKLVYYEITENQEQALIREKQIKGWTRLKKTALITFRNPGWTDLFPELVQLAAGY